MEKDHKEERGKGVGFGFVFPTTVEEAEDLRGHCERMARLVWGGDREIILQTLVMGPDELEPSTEE